MKKIITLLLSAAVLAFALAGCSQDPEEEATATGSGEPSPAATSPAPDNELHAEAMVLLNLLNNYNGDDFDAFFDELMFEHSADPGGLSSFPGGYLFREGDMVPEFHDASAALEVGEISGLVESNFGYHIIYRLPLNYDDIPFGYVIENDYRTLRQIAAADAYNAILAEWREALTPSYTAEYELIDLPALLALLNDSYVIEYNDAFAAFSPDTPMVYINDHVVTWGELFSHIFVNISYTIYNMGGLPDLSQDYPMTDMNFGEALLHYSTESAINMRAYLYGADMHGVTLTQDDITLFTDHIETMLETFGSMDELLTVLWEEQGAYSLDLYEYISLNTYLLPTNIYNYLFGEEGELLSADIIEEFATREGYMLAKHILLSAAEDDE